MYVVVAIVQLVLLDKNNYIDYWNVRNSLYILYACIFISLIIFILFRFNKVFGLILSVLEIVCFQCYDFYINTINSSVSNEIDYTWTIDEIQELDKDTYRFHTNYTDAQPASILNLNKSLEFKYMGTSTYNTMYDEATYKYDILSNSTVLDSSMDWVLSVDDPYSATMLGTKYWIVYKEDELPEELNFAYAYNLDYLSVYENLDYKGFGYTSNNLKYTNEFKSTADFINSILVDDETVDISKYTNIGYSKLNITSMYDNYLEANITLKEDNILLIPIPNNKGWTIKVNGKEVNSISVNGGFVGLELSKGYNEISMNFISPYFKTGLVMSGIGFIGFIMILFLKRK